jgi:hypothetical protein
MRVSHTASANRGRSYVDGFSADSRRDPSPGRIAARHRTRGGRNGHRRGCTRPWIPRGSRPRRLSCRIPGSGAQSRDSSLAGRSPRSRRRSSSRWPRFPQAVHVVSMRIPHAHSLASWLLCNSMKRFDRAVSRRIVAERFDAVVTLDFSAARIFQVLHDEATLRVLDFIRQPPALPEPLPRELCGAPRPSPRARPPRKHRQNRVGGRRSGLP